MNKPQDSEYFDAIAVPVNVEYEECIPVEELVGSKMRPAYDVRLMVKEAIPASLVKHEVIIDVDVSETLQVGCVIPVVRLTQPHIKEYGPKCA